MGKNAYGNSNDDSREHNRPGARVVRPGSRGGRLSIISPEVATFSLANQDKNINMDYEEIKSEGIDSEEEKPDQQNDLDAPQTFKANFVRKSTKVRN